MYSIDLNQFLGNFHILMLKLNSGNQNRIIILGDRIFRGVSFSEFKNKIKNGCAKFKTLSFLDSRETYINSPHRQNLAILTQLFHFEVHDLMQKARSK